MASERNLKHVSVKMEDQSDPPRPSRSVKNESRKKATNKDLPAGATPKFHSEVVPSIWHWAVGHVSDPWHIDEGEMVEALEVIWKHVYPTNVLFDIPPTVSVVSELIPHLYLLMTCHRPINDLLSGTTVSCPWQSLHFVPYLQAMTNFFNITLTWPLHPI
jgi:hypothetical protein